MNPFLQEIISDPDNDTPRLIYADWLDENQEAPRADLIRTQCALEKLDRYSLARMELEDHALDLWQKHQNDWQADLPEWARVKEDWYMASCFRRGFLHRVHGSPEDFLQNADELFAVAPVREAYLGYIFDNGRGLADCPHLARLHELSLTFSGSKPNLAELLSSHHISELRSLIVKFYQEHPTGSFEEAAPVLQDEDAVSLAECAKLSNLRALDLGCHLIGPEGISALAESRNLQRLECLNITYNPLGGEGIRRLCCSQLLERLTELQMYNTQTGDEGWRALGAAKPNRLQKLTIGDLDHVHGVAGVEAFARCESLTALRELDLDNWPVSPERMRALAQSPSLGGIQILNLGGTGLADAAARELAASPYLRSLRFLDLQRNRHGLGPAGVVALARSPVLATVTEMVFFDCFDLGDGGAIALADSEHLRQLRKLSLVTTGLGPKGTRRLAASANLRNLRELDLQSNPIGDEGAKALCESPHLGHIRRLGLYDCGIGKTMADELRKRFGSALGI